MFIWVNVIVYNGEFRSDGKQRTGQMIYPKKCLSDRDVYYKGEWKNDKRDGRGIEIYSDGSMYKGNFKKGRFHENWKFTWADGTKWEETWVNGKQQNEKIN